VPDRKSLRGIANLRPVHLRGFGALIAAVGDDEHDPLALRIDVGATDFIRVQVVERLANVGRDHSGSRRIDGPTCEPLRQCRLE
jgi:hypothetical protein